MRDFMNCPFANAVVASFNNAGIQDRDQKKGNDPPITEETEAIWFN
jgi:hypothetical protein